MISDATAALAALCAKPGFPTDGVVALCDFGASGTSVTLSDAGAGFDQIGATLRDPEFSGDTIDQLMVSHLRADPPDGSLTRLLGECRHAKEQLSAATVAVIAGRPGSGEDVRLSRTEFEQLIAGPLDLFVSNVEEMLQRNGIPRTTLRALATVGGGASIPLITTRLSERLGCRSSPPANPRSAPRSARRCSASGSHPGHTDRHGAVVDTPTDMVGVPPTEVAPAAWAARAASDDKSSTYRALAWSQDVAGDEPVPYAGSGATGKYAWETTGFDYAAEARPVTEAGTLPWYKRAALVLGVAGAGAAVLVTVLLALNLGKSKTTPVNTTPPNQPPAPPSSVTTTVIRPNNSPALTVLPAARHHHHAAARAHDNQPTHDHGRHHIHHDSPPTTTTAQPTTTKPTTSQATTTAPPTTQQTTTAAPVTPTTMAPVGWRCAANSATIASALRTAARQALVVKGSLSGCSARRRQRWAAANAARGPSLGCASGSSPACSPGWCPTTDDAAQRCDFLLIQCRCP